MCQATKIRSRESSDGERETMQKALGSWPVGNVGRDKKRDNHQENKKVKKGEIDKFFWFLNCRPKVTSIGSIGDHSF